MALPASLIASIVSAIIEAAATSATSSSTQNAAQYEMYTRTRTLPPEAKLGVMQPPLGDGRVVIDGKSLTLAPTAQFRNEQNLIVMSMSIRSKKDVVYINDAFGAVYRVWMVSPAEISALPKD